MIRLVDFIKESLLLENFDGFKGNFGTIKKIFAEYEWDTKEEIKLFSPKTGRPHQLFAANLVDEPTSIEFTKFFLQRINVPLNICKITYEDLPGNEGGSGYYKTIKILFTKKFQNDFLDIDANDYFTILNKEEGKIKKSIKDGSSSFKITKKSTTPDALNITAKSYTSSDELIKNVLYNLKSFNHLSSYTEIFKTLMEGINIPQKRQSIDSMLNDDFSFTIDTTEAFKEFSSTDFKNLFNDFGEILGPIFLLNKLTGKNLVLSFPSESNAPLYDYKINENLFISAKHKGGATPSWQNALSAIDEKIKEKIIIPSTQKEKIFCYEIIPGCVKKSQKEEIWNLMKILSKYDNNIKNIYTFLDKSGLGKEFDINTLNNIYLKGEKYFSKFLKTYWDICNYSGDKGISLEEIISKWNYKKPSNQGIEAGSIIYPLRIAITKSLNNNFGKNSENKNDDIISKYISLVNNGFQIYLWDKFNQKQNKMEITFKIADMSDSPYVIEPSTSITAPFNQDFGSHLVR